MIKEVYAAKGIPFVHYTEPRVDREILLHATKEQLELMAEIDSKEMDAMDCYIGIRGSENVSELSDVPAENMAMYNKYYSTPVHHERRVAHTRWVVLRYPNSAMAQLCGTSRRLLKSFIIMYVHWIMQRWEKLWKIWWNI